MGVGRVVLLLSHIPGQAHVICFRWQAQTNFNKLYGCQNHVFALMLDKRMPRDVGGKLQA